jgi:hypothetical protein
LSATERLVSVSAATITTTIARPPSSMYTAPPLLPAPLDERR